MAQQFEKREISVEARVSIAGSEYCELLGLAVV
jgi:hypothetical protein